MNNDSRAAAGRLKKEHDRIRYTAYLMIGIVIAVILVSAFRKFWLTLFFIAAALITQLFLFRRMQKQYVQHAVEENLRAAVCPILADRICSFCLSGIGCGCRVMNFLQGMHKKVSGFSNLLLNSGVSIFKIN